MDGINKLAEQLLGGWNSMSKATRSLFGLILGIGLLVLIGTGLAVRPQYKVLYSGLDEQDAASVVSALETARVDYQLGAGGTMIQVDAGEISRTRLMLAEQGLPKGGAVGLAELFAEPKFGRTKFDQKVLYLRGLQGELERTITNLDAVGRARVHVTMPERAVFEDEKIPPTASVTLNLLSGRRLSDANVMAIQHMIAAAVEGLETEQVTVVDTNGTLLSKTGMDPRSQASFDYKTDVERKTERELTRLLERTVGVGGVHAEVSAEIDFSKTETTEELYDPDQIAVRSESTQEAYEGSATDSAQGLAGAPANQPNAATAAGAGSTDSSRRIVKSKNYEVNRTVIHTQSPTAQVKRLSVSVLVDGTYTAAEDGSAPVFAPRSAEELQSLQQVIETAIGFNAARGDKVKIASVPFVDRQRLDASEMAADAAADRTMMYAAGGGGALLLAAIAFLLLRRRGGRGAATAEVVQFPTRVSELQRAIATGDPSLDQNALQSALAAATSDNLTQLREQVISASGDDPERTAEIIRAWLEEDVAA